MKIKCIFYILFSALLSSCVQLKTVAYLPTADGGEHPKSACPGSDEYLILDIGTETIKVHVFEADNSLSLSIGMSFDQEHSVDWSESKLIAGESVYLPIGVEKIWYTEGYFASFKSMPITEPFSFKSATFYLHYPRPLRESRTMRFIPPKARLESNPKETLIKSPQTLFAIDWT